MDTQNDKIFSGKGLLENHTSKPSSATIHKSAIIEHPVHLSPHSVIQGGCKVGAFSFINFSTVLYPNVEIGRFCSFARGCEIGVAAHPMTMLSTHSFQYNSVLFPNYPGYDFPRKIRHLAHPKTIIENDVWLGAQVIVKSGVKIGNGAVIAANSVVTTDIPSYAIAAGSPAKIKKYRFTEKIVNSLIESRWWELPTDILFDLPFDNIEKCIDIINEYRTTE